jgi:predicted nucleotidyltransferase component of viral defense system
MLDYKELRKIAELKNLSLVNAEKDYLQELILFSLYSKISNELSFKGGTCLYKIYKLDRFSEDLDFTLTKKMDIKKIINKVIADLKLFGIKGKIKEVNEYKNEINIRLLFNGPLYKGGKETQCFIPLNISLKEKIILEAKKEKIIPFYKEIPGFEIFIMDEKEILAEKVRAILTREKPRDIYDLWFLLIRKNIDFDLIIIDKKLRLYNKKFNFNNFIKALNNKKQLWEMDLRNLIIGDLPDFGRITKEIKNKIKK